MPSNEPVGLPDPRSHSLSFIRYFIQIYSSHFVFFFVFRLVLVSVVDVVVGRYYLPTLFFFLLKRSNQVIK